MKARVAAALLVMACCGSAAADLTLNLESKDLGSDPPRIEHTRLYMTADKLAAQDLGTEGRLEDTTIFRSDRQLMWNVDAETKSYIEMDKAALAGMASQLDAAMKQMQEQLAQLPEEQRKQIESAMKAQLPKAAKSTLEVQDGGATQKVEGRSCKRWDVYVNGEKKTEVWAASWKEMGIPKESFTVFQQFSAFFAEIAAASPTLQSFAEAQGGLFMGMDRIDACPVLIRDFEGGQVVHESLLRSFDTGKIAAATFEVPAGYTKKALGEAAAGE